jgi:hypothetical protein
MTGPMQAVASALPSPILAIADPWLGEHAFSGQLAALGIWGLAGVAAAAVLARRV